MSETPAEETSAAPFIEWCERCGPYYATHIHAKCGKCGIGTIIERSKRNEDGSYTLILPAS